ncbi:MAG: thioredoxin family protein [candidate division NC10 bacterium]|nr:thioredoxin family protein [candidate division NC10 bacterium]
MPFLAGKDKKVIQERFRELSGPVKLVNFTQELECEFCHETRRLLEEVAALSDKLTLEVYNFQLDKEKVERYRIDKIPAAVRLAHRFAMESDLVTADMVEAVEFPHLVQRYSVRGVPKTVINEKAAIEGALPEPAYLAQVLQALD